MKKPGESTYSLSRRFLISNYGVDLTDAINSVDEYHRYKLYHFAIDAEKKFARKIKTIDCNSSSHSLSRYRPFKSCPNCMSIGYHSKVFDVPWLSHCPIHLKKLTKVCPSCSRSWSCYSELRKNNLCQCCGIKINFKNLFAKYSNNDQDFEIFSLIHELSSARYPDVMPGFDQLKNVQLDIQLANSLLSLCDQLINSNSVLIFSILKHLNALSDDEVSLLSEFKIPFVGIEVFSYGIDDVNSVMNEKNNCLCKRLDVLDDLYIQLLEQRTTEQLDKLLIEENHLFTKGVSTDYAPLLILGILLKKQKASKYFWSQSTRWPNMFLFDFERDYLAEENHFIGKIIRDDLDDFFRNPYYYLPDELVVKIYQAELWKLTYYAINHVSLFKEQNDGLELIKWESLETIIYKVIYSTTRSNYTLGLSVINADLTVFIPKLLLRNSLDLTQAESQLIDLDFNSH